MGVVFVDGYVGFSTRQYEKNKSFIITNVELVKEDLRNHIFTRYGERPKMPSFGTRIPDLVFEPMDENTIAMIQEDLTEVFTFDPRVNLNELRIIPMYENQSIMAIADLTFIYLNFNDQMAINIQFEG